MKDDGHPRRTMPPERTVMVDGEILTVDETLTDVQRRQLAENGHRLCLLYATNAPSRAPTGSNWEIFSLALLARVDYTLRRMLREPTETIDGAGLARAIYEHVVAFAWIMIDPAEHYRRVQRWEYEERIKMQKDLAKFAHFAPNPNFIRRSLVDMAHESAPDTADRALQAQNHWSRSGLKWPFAFRRSYANLFRPYSAYVHPTVMAMDHFISRDPLGPVVGAPRPFDDGRMLAAATSSFADALVIASDRLGWPKMHDVAAAMTFGIRWETDSPDEDAGG
ncbi:MAG TPA: DUF5677 domain-containing protein [Polyangiaceae bacterium]|nr:DUF5677 domain-containing protein [Polyangiaceae bacterium]